MCRDVRLGVIEATAVMVKIGEKGWVTFYFSLAFVLNSCSNLRVIFTLDILMFGEFVRKYTSMFNVIFICLFA